MQSFYCPHALADSASCHHLWLKIPAKLTTAQQNRDIHPKLQRGTIISKCSFQVL